MPLQIITGISRLPTPYQPYNRAGKYNHYHAEAKVAGTFGFPNLVHLWYEGDTPQYAANMLEASIRSIIWERLI